MNLTPGARARDTRLDRDVALKVLPASALSDDTARVRLLREARLASKLNHPHICTVYDVGETDGQAYIGMELVEGQSLACRLSSGALSSDQVLRYGQQDQAIEWLQRGYDQQDPNLPYVSGPPYNRLRDDPRYQALLLRIGIPAS